ncbi:YggS family pyridoxal phosphate-dependent enzyme [Ruania zhangjianzhongii]|uniref:YggS family pyridoxal phosphate-dependent enzyme n=1 Tax=Ruania zhangjianzhongii TaxID=2603206 RepID=UPI0011C9B6CF|nr:YggS family pyridoxal phosphate-dependent enzyme [Ruania zhangjianzhongii]
MTTVSTAVADIRRRIDRAAEAAGRTDQVRLLLAVKTVDAPRIREALATGETLIGHNRAQELRAVEPELTDVAHESHFIGHLQSNKVNQVMAWADCVQSVDSLRLAERLDRAAATRGRDAGVLIQVNTSGEDTKAGVDPAEAEALAEQVAALEHLQLRGFMTIGANTSDETAVRASYTALAQIRDQVAGSGAPGTERATELSMGMSGDLEIAIAAGATMVRVGTGVFGTRPAP